MVNQYVTVVVLRGIFPVGYLIPSGDIADCHKGVGIFWVEAKDTANHPIMHKIAHQQRIIEHQIAIV